LDCRSGLSFRIAGFHTGSRLGSLRYGASHAPGFSPLQTGASGTRGICPDGIRLFLFDAIWA
jgi:hypothetical protein